MRKTSKSVTIPMDADTENALRVMAAELGYSKAATVRRAIVDAMETEISIDAQTARRWIAASTPSRRLTEARIRGVYLIRCLFTGFTYVGASSHVEQRWRSHRTALRSGRHPNMAMQEAWSMYGESQFTFTLHKRFHYRRNMWQEEARLICEHCIAGTAFNKTPMGLLESHAKLKSR